MTAVEDKLVLPHSKAIFVLFPLDCLVYTSVALVILFFLFCFLINEESTVIGLAVVVSLPNYFYVFVYKDCILVRRS